MNNDHNYQKMIASILNMRTSEIENINVYEDSGYPEFHVTIRKKDNLICPYCSSSHYTSHGFYKKKVIVDNDFIVQEAVFLNARRYICNSCGKTFSDSAHLCPKGRKLSYKMIFRIMELLKSPKMTFKAVSELTGVPVQTVTRVFDHHTHISRVPFPEAICIDEVYTKVNDFKNSKYSCIFYDFYNQKILDVTPCRRKHFLANYLTKIPKSERDNVRYVCIDMYLPYKDIINLYFKKAIICVDSFHVVEHLNNDLNKVRIRIMNSYPPDSQEYYLLKRFKFLLFDRTINLDNKGKFNKKFQRFLNYRQILEMMLSIDIDLYNAYHLKERYIIFNSTSDYESARMNIDSLINDFIKADIREFDEFITLQNNWRDEIVNSFIFYKGRRLSSGIAESINQNIAALLYNTKGIRDSVRRRKRIMYAINKEGFTIQ